MKTRGEELAARFSSLNEEIAAAIKGCTDVQWRATCGSEGWPVGVVAHHVAETQEAFAEMVRTFAEGGTRSPSASMADVDQENAAHARRYAEVSREEALRPLRASGAVIAELLRGMDDAQLARTAGVFGGRKLSVAQVVEMVVIGHAWVHMESIRAALG